MKSMPSSPLLAPEMAALEAPPRFRAPRVMGVINVTPDSFYAGGRSSSTEAAFARGLRLVEEGAEFLDIGGQSTRPGSEPVSLEVELERVIPVIQALSKIVSVPISIDTDKARVAAAALDAGARIINDVTALRGDPDMARVAARAERVVLMHMGGSSPKTMQADAQYNEVVSEVRDFLAERLDAFEAAGGDRKKVWVDPGIGFGKNLEQNLALIKHAGELSSLAPVMLGVSRKSFLGKISTDGGPEEGLPGSLALAAWAGFVGLDILRVHDVLETKKALAALAAVAGIQ